MKDEEILQVIREEFESVDQFRLFIKFLKVRGLKVQLEAALEAKQLEVDAVQRAAAIEMQTISAQIAAADAAIRDQAKQV